MNLRLDKPSEAVAGPHAVEEVTYKGRRLAIILSRCFSEPGIRFFTPHELSQQLAYMHHPAGRRIEPHVHNPVPRQVYYTQEVLFIKKGQLRVDFYDTEQNYLESRILRSGDVILLIEGGHGFEVLEEVEMIEVKQGPYVGEHDKTRFPGIDKSGVKLPA
jgi:mannose-6-phosphate isomerase-like protein (cupin superfamily)